LKIEVKRDSLAKSFNLAASVSPTHSAKGVLNNVKFSATDGGLSLVATDLESGLCIPVEDAEISAAGDELLPTTRMGLILREWSDETVKIETLPDKGGIRVCGRSSDYKLPSENPEEFPTMRRDEPKSHTVMQARALSEALRRTTFCCDPASSRFALGGVLFVLAGPESMLVATDGRRLATTTIAGVDSGKVADTGPILPQRAAVFLQRMLAEATEAKIWFEDGKCWAETDCGSFWSLLVEGRFPNWRQVIPAIDAWAVDCQMPVGPLASMIRQAAIVADAESRGVDFTFTEGSLRAGAHAAELGQSQVDMPIGYGGKKIVIKLDHRFLGEFLKSLDPGSMFRLRVDNAKSPALLETSDAYTYIIMPMALDD